MGEKVADADSSADKKKELSDYYGKPQEYDPTFNGPIKKRGCTDVICCLLFLICFLGMGVVGYFAYKNGDPKLLLYPTDSDGNLCGHGTYLNKPNLVFFDLIDCAKVGPGIVTNGCPTRQICVTECPSTYWTWHTQFAAEQAAELLTSDYVNDPGVELARKGRTAMICDYNVDPVNNVEYLSSAKLQELIENGTCVAYYYPQSPVLGRCVPSFIANLVNKTGNLIADVQGANDTAIKNSDNNTVTLDDIVNGQGALYFILEFLEYGEKFLADVENSKWFIVGGLVLAMIVSFLWIVLMRWLAGIIVWALIVAFIGLFGFSTYYTYTTYYDLKNSTTANTEFRLTMDLSYYTNYTKFWLALGCTSATILTILVLIILFLRKRIMIAISLIKEGSRAIGMMMFTLLWPIWPFIMECALLLYWGATCIYLASSQSAVYGATNTSAVDNSTFDFSNTAEAKSEANLLEHIPCDPNANNTGGEVCAFVKYGVGEYTKYLQVYMLFMLFWVMNFIIGFGQMALAGAFASYYWAFDKEKHMPTFPILSSVGRTLLFHLGSIAFGSLIIAIIQMIRVGLEYLDAKLKGAENAVAKFLLKCLKCCFYLLEKFMKMINKNAYILVAVYGKNFCSSAKQAFFLIMRNIVRVAVLDKVTDFILFIGKLVVVAAITALTFYFFAPDTVIQKDAFLTQYQPELNFYFVPVLIIALGSYVIASCFFSVYGMAVDTLFLCFLEDLERHDGSPEKPYYMSKELKGILGKKNVVESKDD